MPPERLIRPTDRGRVRRRGFVPLRGIGALSLVSAALARRFAVPDGAGREARGGATVLREQPWGAPAGTTVVGRLIGSDFRRPE